MSWESSLVYYRDLNRGVHERLGGLSSPKLVLSTVDFAELHALEEAERWDRIGQLLAEAAQGVERAGADFLVLCTTTFHKVADEIAAAVDIPLLHLADVVAEAVKEARVTRVGLIGTTVAMSDRFFTDRMAEHGVEVIVPARRPPRLPQRRDLRGARPRAHRRPDPTAGRRDRRRALGRRRAGPPGRLHGAGAADLAVRRRPARLPVHQPARRRRPRPRAGLTPALRWVVHRLRTRDGGPATADTPTAHPAVDPPPSAHPGRWTGHRRHTHRPPSGGSSTVAYPGRWTSHRRHTHRPPGGGSSTVCAPGTVDQPPPTHPPPTQRWIHHRLRYPGRWTSHRRRTGRQPPSTSSTSRRVSSSRADSCTS